MMEEMMGEVDGEVRDDSSAAELKDLEMIANAVREYEGVRRKRAISGIMQFFNDIDMIGGRTVAGFGEDAAVIDVDDEHYMLVAMDGIWGRLLEADPWWAGYCAVLVNVNDIAAMGGTPIAMVNVISTAKREICERLAVGISAGVRCVLLHCDCLRMRRNVRSPSARPM